MSIPFLPGNTFADPRKVNHHKQQQFNFKNGYSTSLLPAPSEIPPTDRALATIDPRLTFGSKGIKPEETKFVPAFVALDGQTLQFDAYFKEPVHESQVESYRVRRVKINYFLEDDAISVTEPRVKNSGLTQGTLIRRHRIPKPEGGIYSVEDLNVGQDVVFYKRAFRIVDATDRTRDYLASLGIAAGDAEDVPLDPFTQKREAVFSQTMRVSYADPDRARLRKYLETGGKVLRFYAVWDDRDSLFGEARPFVVHFFLADDTVEILEVSRANSGRDPFPVFMRRQRMPRAFTGLAPVGQRVTDHYLPTDFVVGETVNVLGRNFLIYDADDFTKQYLGEKYGVTSFNVIEQEEQSAPPPKPEIPPYTGFGTEEDSLGSVSALVARAPKKDFKKFIENDGKILRFGARMITTRPEDQERKFIISYFLADDTILVFEPPQRNSGISGGKFLERGRQKKSETSYFAPTDFFVGAEVSILRHKFVLVDADEFAFQYMEANPQDFPQSDIEAVESRLKKLDLNALRDALKRKDTTNAGSLTLGDFRDVLLGVGVGLSDQEMITLLRRYDTSRQGRVRYGDVVAVLSGDTKVQRQVVSYTRVEDIVKRMRTTLAKRGADGIAGLGRSFRLADKDRSGNLSRDEFALALRTYQVPVTEDEVQLLWGFYDRDESNAVDYDEFLVGLRGKMSDRRKAVVREAFKKLDRDGSGVIDLADLRGVYNARLHPQVKAGTMSEDQVFESFLFNFKNVHTQGAVTLHDFEEYYESISASVDDDNHFALVIQNAWNLNPSAVRSKRTVRLPTH